jgi:hypothetical protein
VGVCVRACRCVGVCGYLWVGGWVCEGTCRGVCGCGSVRLWVCVCGLCVCVRVCVWQFRGVCVRILGVCVGEDVGVYVGVCVCVCVCVGVGECGRVCVWVRGFVSVWVCGWCVGVCG